MKLFLCIFTLIISTNADFLRSPGGSTPVQTIRVIHKEGAYEGSEVQTIRVVQQEHGHATGGHPYENEVHTIRVVQEGEGHSFSGHTEAPVHNIRVIHHEAVHNQGQSSNGIQTIRVVHTERPHTSYGHEDAKTIRVIQEDGHVDFGPHHRHSAPEHVKTIHVVEQADSPPVHSEQIIKVIKEEAPDYNAHHQQEQVIRVFMEDGHSHGSAEGAASVSAEETIKIIAAMAEDNDYRYH